MGIKDMRDKVLGSIIPKDVKKEDFELDENEKEEIEKEQQEAELITDEAEDSVVEGIDNKEEFKIKTVIFKEDESEEEVARQKKILGKAKIAIGAGILAVVGITAAIVSSKRRR